MRMIQRVLLLTVVLCGLAGASGCSHDDHDRDHDRYHNGDDYRDHDGRRGTHGSDSDGR